MGKTMAKYSWPPEDAIEYTTKVVEKSKNPDFGYRGSHTIEITQSLIEHMMYNTLKIGVYGMIEGKRPTKKTKDDDDIFDKEDAQGEGSFMKQTTSVGTKSKIMSAEERIKELERMNADLQKKLKKVG